MGVICATSEKNALVKKYKSSTVKLKAVPAELGCLTNVRVQTALRRRKYLSVL